MEGTSVAQMPQTSGEVVLLAIYHSTGDTFVLFSFVLYPVRIPTYPRRNIAEIPGIAVFSLCKLANTVSMMA